ncbi:MAG: hypothetical protein M3069_17995 [Chloroflexota bacterium]|nr:hypothetical protein [Chloroflexota bacterium]
MGFFGHGTPENDRHTSAALQRFIGEVGLYSERAGLPLLAGRMLGWLLIADPPVQPLATVALGLGASKGMSVWQRNYSFT